MNYKILNFRSYHLLSLKLAQARSDFNSKEISENYEKNKKIKKI